MMNSQRLRYLFLGCVLLASCSSSEKNARIQNDSRKTLMVKNVSYPYITSYINEGSITIDTARRR